MADLILEALTSEHFVEIGMGRRDYEVSGYALRDDDGRLQACGGLWFINDTAVATFWSRPGWQPPLRVHRLAIRIVHAAMQAGVSEIWAEEDSRAPNARKWLERFGFERAGHATDGLPVWRLDLDGRSRDDDFAGRKHRHERGWLDQSGPGG
jgi:N-acetylglutamate synthase-like GNAT family acetyltransferase